MLAKMPRKLLYCAKHREGPLDVWYDCSKCEQSPKEEALKNVRWLYKKQYKELLQSSPSPTPPPGADQSELGTSFFRPAHAGES